MKNNHLKICIASIGLISSTSFAQQGSTNNSPANQGQNGTNANNFWSRAGNSGNGLNNSNNIFGTLWNSPIYTQTAGQQRMMINGNNTIAGVGVGTGNNAGYLGIGVNNNTPFFNVDVLTPALSNWGEMHLGVGPVDVPDSKAGFLNAAIGDGIYVPTMFGNVGPSQSTPAITTLGNVDNSQDLKGNLVRADMMR